ncbi:cytochrome P450 [Dichomitus squalens]|uniref:Cytochrome P450 n=2 Tax=Dichomitus squalens TaxID=114155 RepID=A0A4Q9NR91_9APHY|nr:cytochrome P450 [Dichomitus squalens LYAD-421 SS1]EJF61737.1 cytochrome P450 [Dichomitus squalens LYAD-421 SS1]TBU44084.1 cytochrome P450 [Dichomitus squalens]TBU63510.1 cytochrome P450 [Dichomitus squalens]
MPKSYPWVAYRDLCAQYGDIVHLRSFGKSTVVLGSAEVVQEYLGKRAANTSDRDRSPMIELTGQSASFAQMPYGEKWRRHKRAFWQCFYPEAIVDYQPIQRASAHRFLERVLDDPSRLVKLIRFGFASSILKVAYGIKAKDETDPFISIVEAGHEGVVDGLPSGRFLVEYLPFLRHVQPWIPFSRSPKLWAKWQAAGRRMTETPYVFTKAQLEQGNASQSIIAKLISRLSQSEEMSPQDEETTMNVGMVAFEDHQVYSTLQSVFLAMSLYPDVLRKAHAELDAVVGPHRLPEFGDRSSLVYINAIIREAMRWHVVLPLGVPHATTEDDELNGYFIPAGTLLLPATWYAQLHNPAVFEDPDQFRPERFIRDGKLDLTVRDPTTFIFGYGRRICPGRHFGEAALFINVASALHVFDITPPLGADGKPIKVEYSMTDGFNSYPEDMRCTVRPRSAAAEALIRSYASEARATMDE